MDVKNHIFRYSRAAFYIFFVLLCSCPIFCEEDAIHIGEELIYKEYKNYLKEFHRSFGKKMEIEFGLKLAEGGFIHNSSSDAVEFYAQRRATLEEARALELLILNKLAEEVRTDPKLLSYLNLQSRSPESMGVSISFVKLHSWGYDDGSIDHVYFRYPERDKKRYLQYTLTDPFRDYSAEKDDTFSKEYVESFEDAVKLNAVNTIVNPAIHNPQKFEDELNRILTSFEEGMKGNYSLFFRSSGWMMNGNAASDISQIRTKCTYYYSADCQEARALMLLATEKLLTALNSSETLKPYLKEYPFSVNRIKLRMLFRKEKYLVGDVPYYDGSMESAVLSGGTITYHHHIPKANDSSLHDRVVYAKESFQEAQKIFENTPPQALSKKVMKGVNYLIHNISRLLELSTIVFFMTLLFIIAFPQSWLLIIPLIIFFVLRRKGRALKKVE